MSASSTSLSSLRLRARLYEAERLLSALNRAAWDLTGDPELVDVMERVAGIVTRRRREMERCR